MHAQSNRNYEKFTNTKAYEICKNTTLYTESSQNLQTESNEYLEIIQHCKYQVTFPSMNTDSLYVVCTLGVNLENTPPQACKECIGKECIGKGCKNIKVRK